MPVDYKKLEKMPDFLTGSDLIEIGAYQSREQLYIFRRLGNAPKSIKKDGKNYYAKSDVIKFLSPEI